MSKRNPKAVLAAERARKAVDLRIAGATYEKIAGVLGLRTRAGAYKAVARGLAMVEKETREASENLRALEVARLDRMQVGVWAAARSGDVKAIAAALKIMERRAKLLGIDAASGVSVNVGKGGGDDESPDANVVVVEITRP